MRESQIHPAVFVVIQRDDARGRSGKGGLPHFKRTKRTFAIVQECGGRVAPTGEDEIDGAIVVEIGCQCGNAGSVALQPRLLRPVRERAVAVVAPQRVCRCGWTERKTERAGRAEGKVGESRDVEVEVAVMIVVGEDESERKS